MDLNIVIPRIYPDAEYRLDKADPPHKIIEWRDIRPQPTTLELEASWLEYEQEKTEEDTKKENIRTNGTTYYLLDDEEVREIILFKKEEVIVP